jgi:hypothetical protein
MQGRERQMTVVKRPLLHRLRRKRVIIPLGAGLALGVLAYFVLLPWAVRGRVEAVLHQLNLRNVTYRVTRATPWTSTVRDIDAGYGTRVDELRVTYSAGGLWRRRVDNIHVRGMQVTADLRAGTFSLGPLDAVLRASPTSQPAKATPASEAPASAEDWPFLRVRVEDSTLVVRTPDRAITLPFKASLQWPKLHVEAKGLTIDGSVGDPEATAVHISGEGLAGEDVSAVVRAMAPKVPVSLAGNVTVTGDFARSDGKSTFDVTAAASAPAETAKPTTQLASTNLTLEQGVFHIAGTFGGDTEPKETLTVDLKDVALSEASLGAKASGVDGSVRFTDLSPSVATAPQQELRVARLSASKFELTNGVFRFDVAGDRTLTVHEVNATLLGGAVSVKDVRIKPGASVAVTLVAKDVDLHDVLALLAQGKATGEGKVSGQLPLVIAPNGDIALGDGAFEANVGGRLSMTDESTLESIAGEASKSVREAPQAQVRNNIVEALKDFEFQTLSARLKNEPKIGPVAYVRMSGRGRTGARQALDYDLRVAGLSDLVRELISVQRTVTREAAKP